MIKQIKKSVFDEISTKTGKNMADLYEKVCECYLETKTSVKKTGKHSLNFTENLVEEFIHSQNFLSVFKDKLIEKKIIKDIGKILNCLRVIELKHDVLIGKWKASITLLLITFIGIILYSAGTYQKIISKFISILVIILSLIMIGLNIYSRLIEKKDKDLIFWLDYLENDMYDWNNSNPNELFDAKVYLVQLKNGTLTMDTYEENHWQKYGNDVEKWKYVDDDINL